LHDIHELPASRLSLLCGLTFLQYSMDKWIMIECQRSSKDLSHKWGLL